MSVRSRFSILFSDSLGFEAGVVTYSNYTITFVEYTVNANGYVNT